MSSSAAAPSSAAELRKVIGGIKVAQAEVASSHRSIHMQMPGSQVLFYTDKQTAEAALRDRLEKKTSEIKAVYKASEEADE
jgi:hypothetical protein